MSTLKALAKLLPASIKSRIRAAAEEHLKVPSMQWSLRNMRRLGFSPREIIDVGAFSGEWSRLAHEVFPKAKILMIEPQDARRDTLEGMTRADSSVYFYQRALLGAEQGRKVEFHVFEAATAASVLTGHKDYPAKVDSRQLETLDTVRERAGFFQPDFVKLDVQGYELEVLKGAEGAMGVAEVLLLEVSLIELYRSSPLLHQVTEFLATRDYVAYDICGLIRRPVDEALCQADMLFVKKNSPRFLANKHWL